MIFGIDWQLAAELLALGCCTGFLAGLLGVGGGMLLVPFITLILSNRGVAPALAVKMAIATPMATSCSLRCRVCGPTIATALCRGAWCGA